MIFRTEIEIPSRRPLDITHDGEIVMLGSCFTDNVGQRLERDGFDVVHNPMGPLYNPASIHQAVSLALIPEARQRLLMRDDDVGCVHCLNFASRYVDRSEVALRERINAELDNLRDKLLSAKTVILTLGTACVYGLDTHVVGNCHKFPPQTFTRYRLSASEVRDHIDSILALLPASTDVIFTVSPIRHTADTLHGNQLSKATLHLALDHIMEHETSSPSLAGDIVYFPAYEIMLDDLRDYRFYAADMKHPSEVAVDYIYDIFSQFYFSPQTIKRALTCRKAYMRQAHRPIL